MSIQPLEGPPLSPTSLTPFSGIGEGEGQGAQESVPGAISGDAISRMVPPWLMGSMSNPAQTAMLGPLPGLLQQLLQLLQQMMGYGGTGGAPYGSGGNCPPYGNGAGNCSPYGNERFFQNATGASNGDPHLSFNGGRWNSMASHPDLLNSDSIPGGFRVSTQVTTPNAKGVTWNQSAQVTLNNGQTTVGMNGGGQACITSFGRNIPIAAGQTVQLGDGASVTCDRNGSLTVNAQNGMGGQITTTLTAQGRGVNVDARAHDVDLGGALVRGDKDGPGPYPPGPIPGPIPEPVPGPIEDPYGFVNPPIDNPPQPPIGFGPLNL